MSALFHAWPNRSGGGNLWNRRGVCSWTKLTVCVVDISTNFFCLFAIFHHLHHVTRDVNADASAKSVGVKLDRSVRPEFFNIASQIILMTHVAAPAIAWILVQYIRVSYGKSVCYLYLCRLAL